MPYLPLVERDAKLKGKQFAEISRKTYERRRARNVDDQSDMFGYISHGQSVKGDAPRPLTEAEVIADTSRKLSTLPLHHAWPSLTNRPVLIAAGAVSTALCITFMFAYLCRDASQRRGLQEEIDGLWDGVSELDVGALAPKSAPYLDGVINESLRLFPPAPAAMQRKVPEGGMMIDGQYLPASTQVGCSTGPIQRDPRWFGKPEKFLPERWIDEKRPADLNHNPKAFIPYVVSPQL